MRSEPAVPERPMAIMPVAVMPVAMTSAAMAPSMVIPACGIQGRRRFLPEAWYRLRLGCRDAAQERDCQSQRQSKVRPTLHDAVLPGCSTIREDAVVSADIRPRSTWPKSFPDPETMAVR